MIEVDEIVQLYRQRKEALSAVNAKRALVRDAYNGEMRVDLPDIGRNERAAVANLLNTGLDQLAMRVSSTLPAVHCPPRDEQSKREKVAADKRRQAIYGWWAANKLGLMVPRRARQMLAYAQSPVIIRPDWQRQIPVWQQRDPMGTYPAYCMNPSDITPPDCVFAFLQTYGWVKDKFPDKFEQLYRREKISRDTRLTLLEYVDHEELVLIVLGEGCESPDWTPAGYGSGFIGTSRYVELQRMTNRAGICTAVIPGRITLDRAMGQFDGILSMAATSARLMALELIAVEKGIFPDTYLESRPNEQAKFVSGPHDGRTGYVNIVQGGTIREVGTNPGFQTNPTIDRLERAQRLTAGIPAEFGGESASNIRTGRRGDAVLSAAVDFPVQEQQKVLADTLQEENKRAIAVEKAYFGGTSKSFYVHWKGARGQVDYTPRDLWTTDNNIVEYSHGGSDLNGLTILVGQLVGMEAMSKQTGMELLPIVDNVEREKDRIAAEKMEAALMAGIQQKINAGEIAPADGAWLYKQVIGDKMELFEAILELEERVKQRQQEALDQQADPNQPNPMGGLATGTAAEAQAIPAAIPEGPESQQNLTSMLGALRLGQRQTPAERPAVA